MQKYSYVALTPEGKTIKGTMIAQSDEEIKQLVTKNGNYCLSYTRLKDDSVSAKALPLKDLVNLCSQLSSILHAGVPLSSALEMLISKMEMGNVKNVMTNVYEQVQKGTALSDALQKQGKAFPGIMLNMVKAGEQTGDLDKALSKLSQQFDKSLKLKHQIKSAMRYPKILGLITLLVVIILVVGVLPNMVQGKDNVPAATAFLLGLGDFVKNNWPFLLLAFLVLKFTIPMIKEIPKVRYALDSMKVKLPKVGKLVRMTYTATFARTLATLYDGGIQLIDAIQMATATVGNVYISQQMDEAIFKIKKGDPMSKSIGAAGCFDPLLTSMLFVGEESGVLSDVLNRVAEYFDEEANTAVKGLTAMIEPAMMVVMAGVIGVVLLAVVQPMFQFDVT
ncbi:MAG: type II secretion system F family protein [Clostridia bacterium]|nr:type II secretion system F family protein [Clostridia bacterium]